MYILINNYATGFIGQLALLPFCNLVYGSFIISLARKIKNYSDIIELV